MTGASLHWVNDEGNEESVPLTAAETLLGRTADTHVRFPHLRISRHHAKIKKTEHGYLLLDLASVFGTSVNGQEVEHHFLRDGDRIRLSDYQVELLFLEGGNEANPVRTNISSDPPGSRSAAYAVLAKGTTPHDIAEILSFEYRAEMVSNIRTRKLLETELALAHEAQESLLPHSLPNEGHLRIQAFSKPTRHVGGDFYDFLHTESGEFVSILVDVSGKGVAASLLSSMIQGFIQAHLRTGSTLDQTVDELNRFMCERSSGGFATMFVCILDKEGEGKFISAGHNPSFLFRPAKGAIDELSSNNIIVGAFPTAHFEAGLLSLNVGDVLLIYSDGLTEAENSKGDMLGEEAIRQVILTEAAGGAVHLKNKLLETLHDFTRGHSQSDDITIVILERV
jgi:phosphoserine phosphatase RsbU/P